MLLTGRPATNQRVDDFARTAHRRQENPFALDYRFIQEPIGRWGDTQGEVRHEGARLSGAWGRLGGSFLLS